MTDVTPQDVLSFWFEELTPKDWFERSDAVDEIIKSLFYDTWLQAQSGRCEDWHSTPEGALALIILYDQFPRNMFRESEKAFSTDALALDLANEAISKKFDLKLPETVRHFFYMPFMHSENLSDQDRCCAYIRKRISNPETVHHAEQHRDIIARFGRFPFRNEVLGRPSTEEEVTFLAEGYAPGS